MRSLLPILITWVLTACSTVPPKPTAGAVGIDTLPCVGSIQTPPIGTSATANPSLLNQAQAATGQGGLCAGKTLVVQRPIRVYRVWDASKSSSQWGRWWSFDRPQGPKTRYQHQYAICPAWSALDRLIACDLKVQSEIVIGTTQSAQCDNQLYPKTPWNQVYIPNDSAHNLIWVEHCQDEGPWPSVHPN